MIYVDQVAYQNFTTLSFRNFKIEDTIDAGLLINDFSTVIIENYTALNYGININSENIIPNLLVVHGAKLFVRNFNADHNDGQAFYIRNVLNQEFYNCTFTSISLFPKRSRENIPFMYTFREEDDLSLDQTLENIPPIILKNFNVYVNFYYAS